MPSPKSSASHRPAHRLLAKGKERAVQLKKGIQSLPRMNQYVQKFRDYAAKMGQPVTLTRARWLFVRGKLPAEMKRLHRGLSLIQLRNQNSLKICYSLEI